VLAEPPAGVAGTVAGYALAAYTALDCVGLARVDFVLAGDGRPYLTGIVTGPDLGPDALYPRLWAASGLAYPKLVQRLLGTALRRGTGLR